MNYNPQYAAFVAGRCKDGLQIKTELSPAQAHLLHMALGLAGEYGEIVEAINNNDRKNIKEEAGDLFFFAQGIDNGLGLGNRDLEDWRPSGNTLQPVLDLAIFIGEVVDHIKKHVIYQRELNIGNLNMALQGVVVSIDRILMDHNISYDECIADNIEKLQKRYHSGAYSDQQAQERADK